MRRPTTTTWAPGRRRAGWVWVSVALLLIAMTCQGPQGFIARNTSGQTLEIQTVGSGDGESVRVVRAGSVTTLPAPPDGCRGTGVVARTEDGEVVAELDQPACDGDVWVIEEDGAYLRE